MMKAPLDPNTAYYVTDWVTNNVITVCATLGVAKRLARAQGYTHTRLGGNMPNAYVAADTMCWDTTTNRWSTTAYQRSLIYNPRFKD